MCVGDERKASRAKDRRDLPFTEDQFGKTGCGKAMGRSAVLF